MIEAWEYWEPCDEESHPTPLEYVAEFSKVTDQRPNRDLYSTLIREEFNEWDMETLFGRPEEELKELADLVYVIYGYALANKWDLNEALYRVHCNNLSRVTQDDGTILKRSDGKVIKNPNAPKIKLGDLV